LPATRPPIPEPILTISFIFDSLHSSCLFCKSKVPQEYRSGRSTAEPPFARRFEFAKLLLSPRGLRTRHGLRLVRIEKENAYGRLFLHIYHDTRLVRGLPVKNIVFPFHSIPKYRRKQQRFTFLRREYRDGKAFLPPCERAGRCMKRQNSKRREKAGRRDGQAAGWETLRGFAAFSGPRVHRRRRPPYSA
jgi:hypothetical protein